MLKLFLLFDSAPGHHSFNDIENAIDTTKLKIKQLDRRLKKLEKGLAARAAGEDDENVYGAAGFRPARRGGG